MSYSLLRGIVDGDGYIRRYSDTYSSVEVVTASTNLSKTIKLFLEKENISSRIKKDNFKRKNTLYRVTISKKKDVILLANNLYNNASVYLDRKKQNIGSALWKHSV